VPLGDWFCPTCDAPPPEAGPSLVGGQIDVFWPLDKAWYRARVLAFHERTRKHKLDYEADGLVESLELASERWRVAVECEAPIAMGSEGGRSSDEGMEMGPPLQLGVLECCASQQGSPMVVDEVGQADELMQPQSAARAGGFKIKILVDPEWPRHRFGRFAEAEQAEAHACTMQQ
jgi:hypothetical protein